MQPVTEIHGHRVRLSRRALAQRPQQVAAGDDAEHLIDGERSRTAALGHRHPAVAAQQRSLHLGQRGVAAHRRHLGAHHRPRRSVAEPVLDRAAEVIPLHHADHRAARLQRHARRVPAPALGQRALDRVVRIHEPGRRGHHVLGPGSPGDPVRNRAVQPRP